MSTAAPIKDAWKQAVEAAALTAYADWNEKLKSDSATIDDLRKFNEFNARAVGLGADAMESGVRAHLVINLSGGVSVDRITTVDQASLGPPADFVDAVEVVPRISTAKPDELATGDFSSLLDAVLRPTND